MRLRNTLLKLSALSTFLVLAGIGFFTSPAVKAHFSSERAAARPEAVAKPKDSDRAAIRAGLGQMPLHFIENNGQIDGPVAYYLQGQDKTLYFTPQGVTFDLPDASDQPEADEAGTAALPNVPDTEAPHWILKLDFVGANPDVKISGKEQDQTTFSYFHGGKESWRAGLKTYRSILYHDLWPGIDLVYTGTADKMKYEFVVQPGADPAQIKLAYRGASSVKLNPSGQLEVTTPTTSFQDETPYSYQEVGGQRVAVTTTYALEAEEGGDAQTYGFRLGKYDPDQILVIDPVVLVYSGFIGGRNGDIGYDIAVDSSGCAYITGLTMSPSKDFPLQAGPDLTFNGSIDAFVAKVSSDGKGLIYCGYIGGSSMDVGSGIAVDDKKRAYVTGYTKSDQNSFPVINGPDLTFNGNQDAFIARVSADGQTLDYCGYIGGKEWENGNGVAVDKEYSAYIAGSTSSLNMNFPAGFDLSYNGGDNDAFVVKVNSSGSVKYGTYIGGISNDWANAIAVDASGNAYITGVAWSSEQTFPVHIGPSLVHNDPGSQSAFVARINPGGTWLDYCGYIGGTSGFDAGLDIDVSPDGYAYVAGTAGSSEAQGFPVKGGPDLTFNGVTDAFVAKVKLDGSGLIWCGYIGGSGGEEANGIAVDAVGNVYVTGSTTSTEATFPVTVGPDLTYNGKGDAFVAKIQGITLSYCGYVGGAGREEGWGIAVNKSSTNSEVWIVGDTDDGTGFPVLTGPDLTFNGNGQLAWPRGDAFVTKISKQF